MTTRILITDDHPLTRRGLQHLLLSEYAEAEFGEARSVREAVELLEASAWDLVLLDLSLPDRSGLECLSVIKRSNPNLPVLVVSMHDEGQFAARSFRAGASGYVTKDRTPEELLDAVRKVLAGGQYVSEALNRDYAKQSDATTGTHSLHEELSGREFEVMGLIASGVTLTRIAEQMNLSIKTVGTYRARVLKKMGMRSNSELIRYCLETKLV